MHILIIGAAGMIGRKLTERLVADGRLGSAAIERLTLADVVTPPTPQGFGGKVETALMRVTDILLAFPDLITGLLVLAVLGPGLEKMIHDAKTALDCD